MSDFKKNLEHLRLHATPEQEKAIVSTLAVLATSPSSCPSPRIHEAAKQLLSEWLMPTV